MSCVHPDLESDLNLYLSKSELKRIESHLTRKEEQQKQHEAAVKYRNYLSEGSKSMTRNWENSIENVRMKKEQLRKKTLEAAKEERIQKFYKVLEWQAEDRRALNERAQKLIYLTRGERKSINSGLLLSNALYENQKLIELKNKLEKDAADDWALFEQSIIQHDKNFKESETIKKCERNVRAKENQEYNMSQISDKSEKKRAEKAQKMEEEVHDLKMLHEEMEIRNRYAEEDYLTGKRTAMKQLEEYRNYTKQRAISDQKTEDEIQQICDVYNKAKDRIRRIEKQKFGVERKLLMDRAVEDLKKIHALKVDDFEERHAKAVAEKDAAALKRQQNEEQKKLDQLMERKADYDQAIAKKALKEQAQEEVRRLGILERVKLTEVNKLMKDEKDKRQKEKVDALLADWDAQVKEKQQEEEERKAKERAFKWNNFPEKDEKFLKYGEETIAQLRLEGKPTYPVEMAVMNYKKKHCLLPHNPKKHNPYKSPREE